MDSVYYLVGLVVVIAVSIVLRFAVTARTLASATDGRPGGALACERAKAGRGVAACAAASASAPMSRAVIVLVAVVLAVLVVITGSEAAPGLVTPRFPEGATYGSLALLDSDGHAIAHGELQSVPRGDRVESRLVWRFKDGSVQDETTVYAQRPVLKLLSYKQIQRGLSFPADVEVSFARQPGRYDVRRRDRGKKDVEALSDAIELPPDLYNGMTLTVLKSLPAGATGTGQMLAFTPKPRFVKMIMRPIATDPVLIGDIRRSATRYLIDLEIGGIAGIFAAIAGKQPPAMHYWLLAGTVPSFLKFEGPFFQNGPVWRIEPSSARWPK